MQRVGGKQEGYNRQMDEVFRRYVIYWHNISGHIQGVQPI